MKKQPVVRHRRLRKYGTAPTTTKKNEVKPAPAAAESIAPPDTTPYYLLRWMLGWNESNPPRSTKEGSVLYSYRNKYVATQQSEALEKLLADGLIEITEEQPDRYCYKVTPAGIAKLEERFHIRVEDTQEQFRKRQEENLKKLRKKTAAADKPKTTRTKKTATTKKTPPSKKTTSTKRETSTRKTEVAENTTTKRKVGTKK